jgi:hypothetical protein
LGNNEEHHKEQEKYAREPNLCENNFVELKEQIFQNRRTTQYILGNNIEHNRDE